MHAFGGRFVAHCFHRSWPSYSLFLLFSFVLLLAAVLLPLFCGVTHVRACVVGVSAPDVAPSQNSASNWFGLGGNTFARLLLSFIKVARLTGYPSIRAVSSYISFFSFLPYAWTCMVMVLSPVVTPFLVRYNCGTGFSLCGLT